MAPGTVTAQSFNQTLCNTLLDQGYAQVLGWDPDNLLAQAGINRVAQRFIEQSEASYARREYNLALEQIKL